MTLNSISYEPIDICPKQKDFKICIKENISTGFRRKFNYLNVLYDIAPPFVISSTEGIYIELLRVIGKHLKIKINFIKVKERTSGIRISSEFINNSTFDLYAAVFSSKFLGQLDLTDIDLTVTFTEDKIVFITPIVIFTNNWSIFYGEFKNSVWICFVALLISLSLVIFLTDYLVPEKQDTDILSFLLSLLFEGTVTIRTRKKSVKIIFINYLIFVLIFTTIYKSQMFDIIRKDNQYNPIKSRTDMLKFNFKICVSSPVVLDVFKRSKNPIEHYLGWSSKPVYKEYWGCMNASAYEKNAVSFKSLIRLKYIDPNVDDDENFYSRINILEDDFHSYAYFRFAFRKGHPLLEIFNKKLTSLKESGFIQYQHKIYERQFQKAVAAAQIKHAFYFKALKLSTLQSVFFVYFVLIVNKLNYWCVMDELVEPSNGQTRKKKISPEKWKRNKSKLASSFLVIQNKERGGNLALNFMSIVYFADDAATKVDLQKINGIPLCEEMVCINYQEDSKGRDGVSGTS
ncbi:unnamed protein product [Diabrotica balteata]|uniref:Ionotropic glutamate receptor C-terminal domain-containing protein n=1 Tax=Diabrotica balteata TaxID=107213 RepID=A0A9N9XED8_DIABA|nr:unnamed protein product [Diabrotica balteata]